MNRSDGTEVIVTIESSEATVEMVKTADSAESPVDQPSNTTFPTWSSRSERSRAVFSLVVSLAFTLLVIWVFSGWKTIHIAGWVCVGGILLNVVVAYPLIVGSDTPDNSTPQRAIRDYFQSLEHHGPLYRRMWLLLAPPGKQCRNYSDFDSYKLFWKRKTREWRHRAGVGPLTPVVIRINGLDCQKKDSSELAEIRCQIEVLLRGRRHAGPVFSYELTTPLIRGVDNNWYLMAGDLPDPVAGVFQAGVPIAPLANGQSTG